MRQKGTFFPPLVLRWRKPEKGQKASIEEIFEIFLIKNTSAYGKREDVRNLKMDGKEDISTTVGISGRYRFPTAIIDASENVKGNIKGRFFSPF